MPAISKKQQQAAGLALSAKRGETDPKTLTGSAKSMYNSMNEKQLVEFASTKHKELPKFKRGQPARRIRKAKSA